MVLCPARSRDLDLFHAVILGLVEGVTEYLPVSSTGHLILTRSMLGLDDDASRAAVDDFAIVIQGGAILAVLGLYRAHVVRMVRGLLGRDPAGRRLLANLGLAFLPAAVLGFLLDDAIESYLFHTGPVIAAILVGGFFMLGLDAWSSGRWRARLPPPSNLSRLDLDSITPAMALAIGLLQCVAMWPGTSRSMMTIAAGLILGLRPRAAAEFSFLLGLPTLAAASAYTLAKDLVPDARLDLAASLGWPAILVGLVTATLSAAVAVKWLVAFLSRHGLSLFGWYRVALALALLLLGVGA